MSAICGPLLGGAFLAQLVAHRLRIEWFFTERRHTPEKEELFGARYTLLPIEAVARQPYAVWRPSECPLCAAGEELTSSGPGPA